jgi:Uma2 family endonuclease
MATIDEAIPSAVEQGTGPAPYLFTVEQYHGMIAAGILTTDDRAELLDGRVVAMSPKGVGHRFVTEQLAALLRAALPQGWVVQSQNPITFSRSEPEPDLAVIRGSYRDYLEGHPGPADVAVVIEVADSSLHVDTTLKAALYARAGIVEYWVVNLPQQRVERFSRPVLQGATAAYSNHEAFAKSTKLPLTVEGRTIAELPVASFLP